MIVNGAEQFEEGRAQNYLREGHIATLSKAYLAFADEERLSALVATNDIAANDYNLNITRYVNLGEAAEQIDVAMEVQRLLELTEARDEAEKLMMQHLKELGYVE